VEDSKRLLSDKKFHNKQEKDRRLRELNSNNMKRFIDERKRLASKHKQEHEVLDDLTSDETDSLKEENKKVISRVRDFFKINHFHSFFHSFQDNKLQYC
jgi:phosphatidylinositol phospholipase C beta